MDAARVWCLMVLPALLEVSASNRVVVRPGRDWGDVCDVVRRLGAAGARWGNRQWGELAACPVTADDLWGVHEYFDVTELVPPLGNVPRRVRDAAALYKRIDNKVGRAAVRRQLMAWLRARLGLEDQ
jgi:hypothetical protein